MSTVGISGWTAHFVAQVLAVFVSITDKGTVDTVTAVTAELAIQTLTVF